MALSKAFPAIPNEKDLEIKFYSSQQRRDQEPTDFIYDLLKLLKQHRLGMSKEAVVDHIFVRLEPQVQDYVEALWDTASKESRAKVITAQGAKCQNVGIVELNV
ncbi:UNVERIFIED_CONTAM: hypothetical protein NCL1_26901 [Trichonephila clavipes]